MTVLQVRTAGQVVPLCYGELLQPARCSAGACPVLPYPSLSYPDFFRYVIPLPSVLTTSPHVCSEFHPVVHLL